MFMQAGFALVETGFTRAKNVAHTMMMNFMVYVIGMTGYWIMGFALQMGGVGALATLGGTGLLDSEFTITLFGKDFGLFGDEGLLPRRTRYDVAVFALFLFQMVFMDTAATIPTGAMAERWKFSSFVVFGFFLSMISYPLFAQLGVGRRLAVAARQELRPRPRPRRLRRLLGGAHGGRRDGPRRRDGARAAHRQVQQGRHGQSDPGPQHPRWASSGCFILAFGWFGFNPGSTLAAPTSASR